MPATRQPLDATRWHFQHGPIDLVIAAEGDDAAVRAAHEAAWQRFEPLLDELVAELPLLRTPVREGEATALRGEVARRMHAACAVFAPLYITPMAAVAGSVAQEIARCYDAPGITRAWVNNGGDIALHLTPGASASVGVYADLSRFDPARAESLRTDGRFTIDAAMPVRGVATSGWRGRSFSLGIADSVTVLAATAAQADAAASVIANAVNVDDARIRRLPANECKDDSDLGELLVTVDVPVLPHEMVQEALQAGAQCARQLQAQGLIHAAALVCQENWLVVQPLCLPLDAPGSVRSESACAVTPAPAWA